MKVSGKTSPFRVAKTWGSARILPCRVARLEEHMAHVYMDKK